MGRIGLTYHWPMPRRRETRPFSDKSRGIRIQKALAEAGIDSRRHCEELIDERRVSVNGTIIESLPAWVDPTNDRIEVDGHPIRKRKVEQVAVHYYVMLNKPANVVSTNSDPYERTRAIDLVTLPGKPRLFCVGRLDADTTGLLLLTNDGDFANHLTHPRYEVYKTYEVVIKGSLDAAGVATLQRGMVLYDRRKKTALRTEPVRLKFLKRDRDRTHLLMELREGRNQRIQKMMLALEHPIRKLKCVGLGPLRLTGVAMGQWRLLRASEVSELRKAAGVAKPVKPDRGAARRAREAQ